MHTKSKNPRRLGALALLLAVPALLTACTSSSSALEQSAPAEESQSAEGTYTLKVTDPVNNGWLAVAKRDGVLEEALAPLDATVDWVPAKGAVSANLPLFSTGEIQVSEGAFTPVVGAASQDAPIRVGAVLDSDTAGDDSGIIATTASGATEVSDLAGKSIAVNPAGKGEYLVLYALEQEGLTKDDVELQYLQPAEALSAFASGKVDAIATFGDFFRQAKETGTIVATEKDLDSQDREIILFTTDLLEERPDIAKAVVEAAGPLIADRSENPEDYVNVFESSGPRALEGDALAWQIEVNGAKPATLRLPTDQDRERLQSIIDVFATNGVIPEGVKADDLIADLG
ncbi:NrtA/SsuA/CpmA family ABC transporter substrate-binding protein [Leucobacter sp.]